MAVVVATDASAAATDVDVDVAGSTHGSGADWEGIESTAAVRSMQASDPKVAFV